MTNSDPATRQSSARELTAHALLIGDRINTAGFEGQVLSNTPLAVRVGPNGLAVAFRYDVNRKLAVTADTATKRSVRLEIIAVFLIAFEIVGAISLVVSPIGNT